MAAEAARGVGLGSGAAAQAPGGPDGRSILLVAYFYPPSRDTGARRPAAMAKWLRRLGHRVTVLTTAAYGDSGDDAGPTERSFDAQLLRARLRGRKTAEALFDADTYSGRPHPLSLVLVPEPLIAAWAPFACARALRLNRRERFDCVITTSPPESTHLVGRALSSRGVPWVADLRDAWTFERLRPPFPTAAQRRLDESLERRWLSAADVVVCVSEPAAADLRVRGIAEPMLVRNGWDPDDLPAVDRGDGFGDLLSSDRVSLVYTGRFGGVGGDPRPLVDALRVLARSDPEDAARLELVVAGPLTDDERRWLAADVAPARIVLAGTLARERALALQRAADALLLVTPRTLSQRLNFKFFEYIAAGRPILALSAGTEAGRLLGELGSEVVAADDPEAIAAALRRLAAGALEPPRPDAARTYTYPAPAEGMAAAVERAIAIRLSSSPQ